MCDPGAPHGLLALRGVRRNLANTPGASQVSSRPLRILDLPLKSLVVQRGALRIFAIVLIRCFDLGLPQGPRGSQGVTEMFSGISVVYRAACRALLGPLGLPMASRSRRLHRSTRGEGLASTTLEIGEHDDSQLKKGSVDVLVHMRCCLVDVFTDLVFQFQCFDEIGIKFVYSLGIQQTIEII